MSEPYNKIYEMLVKATTGIDVLTERLDRHIPEQKADINHIYEKLEAMTANQHKNKEELINKIHENNIASKIELTSIGTKVSLATSGVVTVIGVFIHWIISKIKGV